MLVLLLTTQTTAALELQRHATTLYWWHTTNILEVESRIRLNLFLKTILLYNSVPTADDYRGMDRWEMRRYQPTVLTIDNRTHPQIFLTYSHH